MIFDRSDVMIEDSLNGLHTLLRAWLLCEDHINLKTRLNGNYKRGQMNRGAAHFFIICVGEQTNDIKLK